MVLVFSLQEESALVGIDVKAYAVAVQKDRERKSIQHRRTNNECQ